jgi:ribosomal protein S18 acetylase RimI-like enzyme
VSHPSTAIDVVVATEVTDDLVAAFARLLPQLSSSAEPLDRAALAAIIGSPCTLLLLARDRDKDGEIVGTLTLAIFRIPTAMRAWIEDVVVDAGARGRGVGERLTQAAIRLATERGARTIDLTSRPSREAARRLYVRLGFEVRNTDAFRYDILARDREG